MNATHSGIEGVQAIEEAPGRKRVVGVEWGQHDAQTCEGQHLEIDTTGFLTCPVSMCRWAYDPEFSCPKHGDVRD